MQDIKHSQSGGNRRVGMFVAALHAVLLTAAHCAQNGMQAQATLLSTHAAVHESLIRPPPCLTGVVMGGSERCSANRMAAAAAAPRCQNRFQRGFQKMVEDLYVERRRERHQWS